MNTAVPRVFKFVATEQAVLRVLWLGNASYGSTGQSQPLCKLAHVSPNWALGDFFVIDKCENVSPSHDIRSEENQELRTPLTLLSFL